MKGGGIVLLVIFVFLFICFVWGITSVVNKARDAIKSRHADQKDKQIPKSCPTLAPNQTPSSSMNNDRTTELTQNVPNQTLEQLERIGKLRREGTLTEEEFIYIKKYLMNTFNAGDSS